MILSRLSTASLSVCLSVSDVCLSVCVCLSVSVCLCLSLCLSATLLKMLWKGRDFDEIFRELELGPMTIQLGFSSDLGPRPGPGFLKDAYSRLC